MNAMSVDEYFKKLPHTQRKALENLRKTIKSVSPDEMSELISYGIPSLKYKSRQFVSYAGYPDTCTFIVMSYEVMEAFKADLRRFKTDRATIFFTAGNPLPAVLVRKLIKARIAEIDSTLAAKKKSSRGKS